MKLADLKQQYGAFRLYLYAMLALALSFYLGYVTGNWYQRDRESEMQRLQHTHTNLTQENNQLNRQLNVLNVELEVARLAMQEAQQNKQEELQQQIEMENQLGFYQRVMAPEQSQQGVMIEAFDLQPALSERHYRFALALTQQDRRKGAVKGNIKVTLIGNQQQKVKHYDLATLRQPNDQGKLTFSFRYFQVLEGVLVLPADFEPEKIKVVAKIYQFNKKRGELTRTFDWAL